MIEKIGGVLLDYEYYPGIDLYSDGEIEKELLNIVSNYNEDEFQDIIDQNNKWPILYHLSPIRANIVEGLSITKEDVVLEIGAGCGAITGTLADKAKRVICIELSKQRSLINATRNKNRNNIEILVGNFEDIEKGLEQKFDYITLIGVYEYAESYIGGDDAYCIFLQTIYKHIRPGGKLVIAIENKLGMKYWAGAAEDHLNKLYEGIEGYKNSIGVKTFTRKELEDIFYKCEIKDYTFYYPYPDYKLPDVIYSDEYLPSENELNNNEVKDSSTYINMFDQKLAFNNVIDNEMFSQYSNSYLIVIEKEQ